MNQSSSAQNNPLNPVVSVITVVFNGVETLDRTIKSVISQTYPFLEYIVVDGGSTDGTLDIIECYSKKIHHFVCEPDKGLYDAMNKGMKMATGQFFWFINSGDEIAGSHILEMALRPDSSADFIYGDTMIVDAQGNEIGLRRLSPPPSLTWKDLRMGMLVSHQSVIVSRDVASPYNLDYRFSADFEWVMNALRRSKKIVHANLILSHFLEGGLTQKNIIPGLKERFHIMKSHFGLAATLWYHIPISFKFIYYLVKHKRF
jgi:glycosyltransferase involved in cell wall biosynthesis